MCLIVVKPKDIDLPKEAYLLHAAKRNSDGQGLAYVKKGEKTVRLKKDFATAEQLIAYMNENITKEDDLVIHFRLATHGLKDEGNCHPFPITKNKLLLRKTELECKSIMAHNGVLSQYNREDDTELSDSQRFVLEILSDSVVKENLQSAAIQRLVTDFLGGDRLVVLNSKGELILFGDFKEEDGISYSNAGFKPVVATSYARNYSTRGCIGYHGGGYGVNHWGYDAFGRTPIPTPNEAKKEHTGKKEKINMRGKCDGCSKFKKLCFCDYEEDTYALCKTCRKKARKKTLVLDEESVQEKKQIKEDVKTYLEQMRVPSVIENGVDKFECTSCREDFPYKELNLVSVAYLVCDKCKLKMKEDSQSSIIFNN